jgi:hypothetical protein
VVESDVERDSAEHADDRRQSEHQTDHDSGEVARERGVDDQALDRQNLPRQETVEQVAKTEPQTEPAKEKDESGAKRTKRRFERDSSGRQRRQHETESFFRTLTCFDAVFGALFRSELNSAKSGFYDFRQICFSILENPVQAEIEILVKILV